MRLWLRETAPKDGWRCYEIRKDFLGRVWNGIVLLSWRILNRRKVGVVQ